MDSRLLLLALLALVVVILAFFYLRPKKGSEGFANQVDRFVEALNHNPNVPLNEMRAAAGGSIDAVTLSEGKKIVRSQGSIDRSTGASLLRAAQPA